MKRKTSKRRKALYVLFGLLLFLVVSAVGGMVYIKSWWFQERPNTLAFVGELHTIPFEWTATTDNGHTEPHAATLIPVTLPGLQKKFYMQFDTGSPYTFVRSGALESLRQRGHAHEVRVEEDRSVVERLELDVGGNRVVLNSGHVLERTATIDWEDPDSIAILGSFGTDLLAEKVCAIDFPAQQLQLYRTRPESLTALGEFVPFDFSGRRIMLPSTIAGTEQDVFYDSGCSAFGLLTSKYHFDRFTDPNVAEIQYSANRFGDSIPVHHKPCSGNLRLGTVELPLERVSYVELYEFFQATLGRFSFFGGFLGNKALLESTLILDTEASEFLLVRRSLQAVDPASGDPEVTRWIRSSATALEPKQESYGRVGQAMAAARVVGLGEATHGQHEAFDLKRRLTMHLIRHHGFRVVAYEASASRAMDCDAYVAGRSDDREKAVAGFGMLVWQVEENARLLDDLREWNRTAKPGDRVRFLGCDAQSGGVILARLTDLLTGAGERGDTALAKLKALLDRSMPATRKAQGGDRADLDQLLEEAAVVADEVRAIARAKSVPAGAIDIRLREFVAHLGLYGSVGARDRAMAELLLAQLGPPELRPKCVVWGHNAHVQRSPLTYMRSEALAMGGHLAKALGRDYYALGFFFGCGEFQANARDETGRWRFKRYRHAAVTEGSLDAFFAAAVPTDFVLDLRSAPSVPAVKEWLTTPRGHRWWGGYNISDDFDERTSDVANLSTCAPGGSYDGIAFHHRTTAAQPVNAALIMTK
ncbi:MAG: erythromycin esterase family protein [bacterium]|nr:erythromycin esterase family protein [bacterium]